MGGKNDIEDVVFDFFIYVDFVYRLVCLEDFFWFYDWVDFIEVIVVQYLLDDFVFFFFVGVGNFYFEYEVVDLCFGQGVSFFLFDGVLGGQYEKRFFQVEGLIVDCDLLFLYGFEQGILYFGRCLVDFVSQYKIGKDWIFMYGEFVLLWIVNYGIDDISWQQVGCKLNMVELGINSLRKGFNCQCFGKFW